MKKLTIFYDDFCPNCIRFANLVQKINWLKLIQVKKLRNEFDINSFRDIDLELAKKQMASYDSKWHYGYDSLFYIFLRLPLIWAFIPFFFLLKITKLGQFLYKEFALKRKIIPIHCDTEICDL